MSRRVASVALIFLVVIGLYARVSHAFFCGYDDFLEIQRAAFEDTQNPSRMISTTHFQTSKYRPLNRALIFATYWLGGGRPIWFRLRNLGFHLLAVAMVYGLGWLLFQSGATAFVCALLFGVHPLANQCVVASSWTITAAYALLLTALFLFLYALQDRRRTLLWLGLALVSIWLGLFVYEATIVIFGLMLVYLAVEWAPGGRPVADRRFLLFLTLGSALVCATFFVARFLVVSTPTHVVPLRSIVKNTAMYAGALILPVDAILAHDAFGAPLPPEIRMSGDGMGFLIAIVLAAILLGAVALYWSKPLRTRLRTLQWPVIAFLIVGIGVSLLPFLFFTNHASETYLYLPAALYALLLGSILRKLFRRARSYAAVVGVFVLLFGAGTWRRNEHVTACGAIAHRILTGLPVARWREGTWSIRLANFPGDPMLMRYGIYEYLGLSTIDVGDPTAPAAQCALQLATHNQNITAEVVSAARMSAPCPRAGTCFWVHSDGRVAEVESPGPAPSRLEQTNP